MTRKTYMAKLRYGERLSR